MGWQHTRLWRWFTTRVTFVHVTLEQIEPELSKENNILFQLHIKYLKITIKC